MFKSLGWTNMSKFIDETITKNGIHTEVYLNKDINSESLNKIRESVTLRINEKLKILQKKTRYTKFCQND